MKKALLVLASLAAAAFAGCASSSNNPWAPPDAKPVPRAASVPADDSLFADDPEWVPAQPAPAPSVATAPATVPATVPNEDLLADFPAIRQANLEKALRALKAASAVEELPMPDKGNARITRYNNQVGVIEFLTPDTYAIGDRIVLTKENKPALVSVIAIDGNRIVADLAAGVKGGPVLKPGDYVICAAYRTPEEIAKQAEAERKAQREAIIAARAAAQAERAALSGLDDEEDEEEDVGEEDNSESGDEEASDGDSDEDDDW